MFFVQKPEDIKLPVECAGVVLKHEDCIVRLEATPDLEGNSLSLALIAGNPEHDSECRITFDECMVIDEAPHGVIDFRSLMQAGELTFSEALREGFSQMIARDARVYVSLMPAEDSVEIKLVSESLEFEVTKERKLKSVKRFVVIPAAAYGMLRAVV